MSWSKPIQNLADYRLAVEQVLIHCWPRIDQDVDLSISRDVHQGYQSRVSIDTRLRLPLVYIIQSFFVY